MKSKTLSIPKKGRVSKILNYVIGDIPIEFNAYTESEKEVVFVNGQRSMIYSHAKGNSVKRLINIILDKGIW